MRSLRRPLRRGRVVPTVIGVVAMAALSTTFAIEAGSADAATVDPGQYTVGATVASDEFDRTVTSGLGSAGTGGGYTLAPTTAPFSVSGGAAQVTALAPGSSADAVLSTVSSADTQVQWAVRISAVPSAGNGLYVAGELRYQSDKSAYRAEVNVGVGGKVSLSVGRESKGGAETKLGTAATGLTLTTGQRIEVQARIVGTNPVVVGVRTWLNGTTMPADFQLTAADPSSDRIAGTGAVGLWAYLSSGSTTTSFTYPVLSAATLVSPGPSPSPTPGGGGSTDRGSLPVGSADYPVPGGAVFVSSSSGSDSNAGSQAAPLKTVTAAINKAAAGGTIALRAGTYHESITVWKTLTIQAYPKEAVWFDGSSVVSSWTRSGSTWVHAGWTNQFDHSSSYTKGTDDPSFINPSYPMAAWPDAVWVNGVQLNQVASPSQVTAGTFAVDYPARTLTIGSDPTGQEVRSADLTTAVNADGNAASNVVLQGFGVRHYGTAIWQLGTVRLARNGDFAGNLVIQDSSTTAISFGGSDTADHITITGSGMLGVHGSYADKSVIEHSVVTGNNREHFNIFPVAGGIKLARSKGVTITDNNVSDNIASTGIWLDESCSNFTITDNSTIDNQQGIETEISDTGIIANNEFSGGQLGLYILNTGNVKVFNNTFYGHADTGAYLAQDARRQATDSYGRDPRDPVPNPNCPWLTRNVTFADNAFLGTASGGRYQILALDHKTHIPADRMNLTIAGNIVNPHVVSADPYMIGWGGSDNVTVTRYATPDALNSAQGKTWPNFLTSVATPTAAAVAALASVDAAGAVPLPADVATAIGETTGTKHIGRF